MTMMHCQYWLAHMSKSGGGIALLCEQKGPQGTFVIHELEDWLNEIGILGPMRLRTDSEPLIIIVAQ